jgi:hypothetical protein
MWPDALSLVEATAVDLQTFIEFSATELDLAFVAMCDRNARNASEDITDQVLNVVCLGTRRLSRIGGRGAGG